METLKQYLRNHPFLKDVSPQIIDKLLPFAFTIDFENGEFICRRGEDAEKFYLIEHGKIVVGITSEHYSAVHIQTLTPGNVLGWSWLVPPYKWEFDAQATEFTHTIAVDGQSLRAELDADHDLGYEILNRFIRVIGKRVKAAHVQFWDIYKMHYLLGKGIS